MSTNPSFPFRDRRGLAAVDEETRRAISSKGGKAAQAKGTAHRFTADKARRAGRLGGEAVSRDRAHMAEIGRLGGLKRAENAAAKARAKLDADPSAAEDSPID